MISELLQTLTNRTPPAPLCPTQIWKPEISSQISAASDEELFGSQTNDETQREMRLAVRAGLLLMNDDLHASHEIAQDIKTSTGSFWHSIMHRREGDFSNANYWCRQTGNHAAFEDVLPAARSTLIGKENRDAREFFDVLESEKKWNPPEFVAACEKAASEKRDAIWLQELQLAEMTALLNWCWKRAN